MVWWINGWMCLYVCCGWVDICMDVSVGVWWLGGYMNGCVVSWVDLYMDVSVGVWCLDGFMDECVFRWVDDVWITGWICL